MLNNEKADIDELIDWMKDIFTNGFLGWLKSLY
jgi:hypothetical protein